jgi:hypothetical protein
MPREENRLFYKMHGILKARETGSRPPSQIKASVSRDVFRWTIGWHGSWPEGVAVGI